MRVSQEAFDLIVSEEVTSKSHYEAKLRHTEWPGASSGVTVGIGYDLGQTDREKIREDWRGRVSESMLSSMLSASGVTGRSARSLAAELKAGIDVPWDVAVAVHRECVLPRWEAIVEKALPNTEKLSPDCFGALVSLTFNRGASFDKEGDRYREMRAIKAHMAAGAFDKIPAEIRSMKRIWQGQGVDGLLRRRDAEANMFQHGLSAPAPTLRPAVSEPADRARAGEGMMATGAGLLRRAREHIGERYVFGARPPKDDPQWKGPWDCAEFVSWLVYQEAGILYGCVNDNVEPSEADAYTGGWRTDVERRGIRVSVEKAAATVGGIVLRYPRDGATGHIALCDGKGGTVEAHSTKRGLIQNTVQGRRWDTGVFVPGITYDTVSDMPSVRPPEVIYFRNAPNMDRAIIIEIQKALASKGFSPGEIDGDFGPQTEAAVLDFQLSEGLLADGEVGPDTAAELGISLTPAKQPEPGTQPEPGAQPEPKPSPRPGPEPKPIQGFPIPIPPIGIGTMNPFIFIAARVFPEILKAVVGDKAGTITGVLTKVITDVTHANTPEEARDKLNADPEAVAKLQLELATIANDYELARRKAELDLIKEQNEQEIKRQQTQLEALKVRYEEDAKKREADFQGFRAGLEDTKDARASLRAMAAIAGADKWLLRAPPILSYMVTIGFFLVLAFLLLFGIAPWAKEPDAAQQVVYIVIGALTAALATVVNFWLGSSQSSQRKDAATERQAIHNTEFLEKSAKQNAEVLEKSAKQTEAQTKAFQSTIATVIEKRAGGAATKASNAIERCVDIVLKHETDPDLKKLPPDKAREIYRTKYWNVLRCDDLPAGVDLVVFDFGAEAGPAEAAAALQRVVGAEADSSVGPATIAATKAGSPSDIVMRLSQLRRESKRGSSEGIGRINEVEIAAQQMVAAASAVAV